MFYLPPQEFWYLTAARLAVTFDDGKEGAGTGFFVLEGENYFLITARHLIDPRYWPANKKRDAVCQRLKIFFQCAFNPGTPSAEVRYQIMEVGNPDFSFEETDVDVAAIRIPRTVLPIVRDGNVGHL